MTTDLFVARVQAALAFLVGLGFLGILGILLVRPVSLNDTTTTILTGLLATLGTIFTLIANYFFARHRPNGDANDPIEPVTPAPTETPK